MKSVLEPPPPGFLDFVVWDSFRGDHDYLPSEAFFELQLGPWSKLPAHLLHLILARLPFQSILRFRCVCRDWKAFLASPSFHHFPSHAPHVPPWIFFRGTPKFRRFQRDFGGIRYDDGRDDDGFVFEGCVQGSDGEFDSFGRVCGDSGNAQDSVVHDERGDIYGATLPNDHESMQMVVRSCDHVNTQDAIAKENDDMKYPQTVEELLLIFDTTSESWRTPLNMLTAFKIRADLLTAYSVVCSSQEHILIANCCPDMTRLVLFNPGASLLQELPPCIRGSRGMEGVGFTAEMASDIPTFSIRRAEQSIEATADKIMQVVVIGYCGDGRSVVEKFSFTTGCWHICGYLPSSDDLYFLQSRMMFYRGSFYGITAKGIMKLDIAQEDQSIEYTLREAPIMPRDNDPPWVYLRKAHLLATIDSLYMVGVTYPDELHLMDTGNWNILIWEYLPHAADNACWNFQSYVPKPIRDDYFGGCRAFEVSCLAHGDLMFFGLSNRQRFLIFERCTKVWRFSRKSRWTLGDMSFVWEPLLRN